MSSTICATVSRFVIMPATSPARKLPPALSPSNTALRREPVPNLRTSSLGTSGSYSILKNFLEKGVLRQRTASPIDLPVTIVETSEALMSFSL